MFFLLFLDIPMDFAMVKHGSCWNCTQHKLGCNILKMVDISKKEFKIFKKEYDIKGFNVKCDCDNFTLIKIK